MKRLLLDTNVLLLFLVGLLGRDEVQKFKRTSQFTVEDYDLLANIIAEFGKPLTTPNILTEVSNLSGQFSEDKKEAFFTLFATTLQSIDEQYVPSGVVASDPVFKRLGLTDAAISQLATSDSVVVMTADLPLWMNLSQRGLKCVNFNHLRSSRILEFVP